MRFTFFLKPFYGFNINTVIDIYFPTREVMPFDKY